MNEEAKIERQKMRQHFFDAWQKKRDNAPLDHLEQQLVNIICEHPEYHYILEEPDKYRDQDYSPEAGSTNPFFHMALHASLMEQITTDRPKGILDIYTRLAGNSSNSHQAEHKMMEVLAALLWQAQKSGQPPDQAQYLKILQRLE
jgi:hypothetical protein